MAHLDYLAPVDGKLKRATAQLALIAANSKRWGESTTIEGHARLLEARLGYEVRASHFELDLVEETGWIAGEYLHNLRSSLDNLMFALARLRLDPPASPSVIQFPICKEQSSFGRYQAAMDQLAHDAAFDVERMQPFQRRAELGNGQPGDDPLVLLHRLNISDKHRIPVVVSLVPETMTFTAAVQFDTEEGASANVPPKMEITLPLQPNAVFARWVTTHPITVAEGSWTIAGQLYLQTDQDLLALVPTLKSLLDYVYLLRNHFARFFE